MRFSRFEAIRYGKFTDARLDFPASSPDFHVVYGPNEAGKSTLRAAIVDFLFGIPGQTAMGFLHPYPKMLLGATLVRDGSSVEWRRRKGNRDTLLTAEDERADEPQLAAWLGPADRAFYERMFALDHEGLRRGGRAMLHERDDVGAALFAAASGAVGLHELRLAMSKEADGLWKARGSANAYAGARRRMEDAAAEKKIRTARVEDWLAANERLQAAERAWEDADRRREGIEAETRRLERIRNVAPRLLLLRRARAELTELGDVPALPADAAATVSETRQAMVEAETDIRRWSTEIARIEGEIATLAPDAEVLLAANEIAALADNVGSVRKERGDLVRRREEFAATAGRIRAFAAKLDWLDEPPEILAARLPPADVRRALQTLLETRGAARATADASSREVEARRADLAAALAEAQVEPEIEVSPEWAQALANAQALGDVDAQRRALERGRAQARDEFERAVGALSPWLADADELRAPPPATEETARRWIARADEIDKKLDRAGESIREIDEKRERYALEREQIQRDGAPVAAEELADARVRRDALWARIAKGEFPAKDTRAEYESLVRAADELADRRFAGAGAANEWNRLGAEIERVESDLAARRAEADALRIERDRVGAEWRAVAESIGDPAYRLTDYPAWLAARQRAEEKAAARRDADANLEAFDRRVADALDGLMAEWRRSVGEPERTDGELAVWVRRTASEHERRKSARKLRDNAAERGAKLRREAEKAERTAGEAAQAWSEWERSWRERLAAAGLPSEISPERVSEALAPFAALEAEIAKSDELGRRIGKIERDIAGFEAEAARLAEALAPDCSSAGGEAIAAKLRSLLESAIRERERREALEADLRRHREDLAAARAKRDSAEALLGDIRASAGVRDLDALRRAIERSDRARMLRTKIDEAESEAIRLGQRDLASLESEFDSEDLDTLAGRLAEAGERLESAKAERDERLKARENAKRDLDEFGGGDAAAQAEARRQEALAEMTDIAARWVRAKTAERLLEWAVNRFREERQGPLIGRATEIFAGLTRGSFAALAVDYDDTGSPRLVGRRPRRPDETDNETVGVDGLSDGARDQLYLALRLAAVELHLQSAPPLPFLADDLFVHWDDERAEAGFSALKELATRTQVLFLTHHRHLIDVAKRAIGPDCPVVELEA